MLKFPVRRLTLLVVVAGVCAAPVMAASRTKSGATADKTKSVGTADKSGPRPEVVGFWRFEHDVKPEGHGAALGAARRMDGNVYFFNDEVPGPFIYDPLQKLSYPNSASLSFQSDDKQNDAVEVAVNVAKTGLAGQSVTLELFCKPNGEWSGPLAMKSRMTDAAAEWGIEALSSDRQNQTYLQGFFTSPGAATLHFRGGHFGTSAQVRNASSEWRHVAFVYDATARTASCYIDYYQVKTIPIPGEMKWDTGPFYIGGGRDHSNFGGKIDEVRLTKGALRPSQFLRARRDPLAGVSFDSLETLLPRDCGYVDLKESFGALGDGKSDDTAAFREAFRVLSNQAAIDHNTLYVPPGTYLVTDQLVSGRSLTVIGAGPDRTVIKLRDKCSGFLRSEDAHAAWKIDSAAAPAVPDGTWNDGAAGIGICHLTIDTGKGNLGAKGLEVSSNLLRQLDDLQIRSGDGAGLVGLDLAPKTAGSALIKNLRVKGYDYGILASGPDATTTMLQIAVEGQRLGGIKNMGSILAIRQLTSTNKATALMSLSADSMVSLLDSSLKGGSKDVAAIQCEGGLCALRVETAGYNMAIRKRELVESKTMEWKDTTIAGPKIDEYAADTIVTAHGAKAAPLQLPVENTPEVAWGDIHKDWVNIFRFADKKDGDDWAPAIQAAIDSGAKTVYFPPGDYGVQTAVHLRGKIERLFGLHSHITRSSRLPAEDAALIFDEPGAKRVVSVECLELDGLRNLSPATLVLKSTCPGHYDNAEGCGKLFMENVAGADFQFSQPQSVWVYQWNNEKHGIFSHGATIWCLGLRAGAESGVLSTEGAASTEIFGALIRPASNMDESRPFFRNTNSRLSLIYATTTGEPPHSLQIVDTQGNDAEKIESDKLRWISGRGRMDLFRSDATPASPGNQQGTPEEGKR